MKIAEKGDLNCEIPEHFVEMRTSGIWIPMARHLDPQDALEDMDRIAEENDRPEMRIVRKTMVRYVRKDVDGN